VGFEQTAEERNACLQRETKGIWKKEKGLSIRDGTVRGIGDEFLVLVEGTLLMRKRFGVSTTFQAKWREGGLPV
jgi:hypothetical protein